VPDNTFNITIEDAKLIPNHLNFEGREGQYNEKGQRNFSVVLDPVTAEKLLADGWNVKGGNEDAEGNVYDFFLPVAVGFNKLAPRIYLIAGDNRTQLGEEEVAILDNIDIRSADMTLRGRIWGDFPNGKGGVKAWLRSLFVTIDVDPLDEKYGVWKDRKHREDDEEDE
jgi:hypothetical protein